MTLLVLVTVTVSGFIYLVILEKKDTFGRCVQCSSSNTLFFLLVGKCGQYVPDLPGGMYFHNGRKHIVFLWF